MSLAQVFAKTRKLLPDSLSHLLINQLTRRKREIHSNADSQVLLAMQYRMMAQQNLPLPTFDEVGFSAYSGSNEDGIFLYIFSLIGTTDRQFVDIGAGSIAGSNTANLVINHGWTGLHLDLDTDALNAAQKYYRSLPSARIFPPTSLSTMVTAENVNELLTENNVTGEIDLFSIDIDGVDYWVWKALNVINPRVVVAEYQPAVGGEKAWTVPYNPDFNFSSVAVNRPPTEIVYAGASLRALTNLAEEKGYRLVGCNRHRFNAFFVRNDLAAELLPAVDASICFDHPRSDYLINKYFDKIAELEWVEV